MVCKVCSEGCSEAKRSNLSGLAWKTPLILFKSTSHGCVTLQNWRVNKVLVTNRRGWLFFLRPLRENTRDQLNEIFVSWEWFGGLRTVDEWMYLNWKWFPRLNWLSCRVSRAVDVIFQSDGARRRLFQRAELAKGWHTASTVNCTHLILPVWLWYTLYTSLLSLSYCYPREI